MELERTAIIDLEKWFSQDRRKPLVIRGARQVGKSTLVRLFAEKHGLNLFEVNLERYSRFDEVFKRLDVKEILTEIEYFTGQGKINQENSLIFLDEIQSAPHAIKALRYFYEDFPQIPVIAAGSLLELTLSDHSFAMPVGRMEYLFLGPMSFEEFLLAGPETQLLDLLNSFDFTNAFPQSAHRRLLELLRAYLLVGGMPEAVKEFLSSKHLEDVIRVHSSLLETYRDDFGKYARGGDLLRIQKVFDHTPLAVGEKVVYRKIDGEAQSRETKKAIDLLAKAGIISRVHHASASGIPLRAGKKDKVFKLYFLDVGLMNRMCGIDHLPVSGFENDVPFINKGKMAEQFIAQHLLSMGFPHETPQLHYWLREGRAANAEVDFLIQAGGRILPIEVKAGKTGSLKSLHQFIHEKKQNSAVRFDFSPPSQMAVEHKIVSGGRTERVRFELLSLPLYMVGQTIRLEAKQPTEVI